MARAAGARYRRIPVTAPTPGTKQGGAPQEDLRWPKPPRFGGYPRSGVAWLREIVEHNDRAWFHDHRERFERDVRAPTLALVADLNQRLERFAPEWVVDPLQAVQRIHRDLRFTTDRRPYKTWMAARFGRLDVPRGAFAGLRISASREGVEVRGGAYAAAGPYLRTLRERMARDAAGLRAAIAGRALRQAMGELQGPLLQRVPAGFDPDAPDAELLRRRQLYFQAQLPPAMLRRPELSGEIARRFRLLTPLVQWLETAIGVPP